MAVKGQALTKFIIELTYVDVAKIARTADNAKVAKVAEALGEKNFIPAKEDSE